MSFHHISRLKILFVSLILIGLTNACASNAPETTGNTAQSAPQEPTSIPLPTETPLPAAEIVSVHFGEGVDDSGEVATLINEGNSFPEGIQSVYTLVQLKNVNHNTRLKIEWIALSTDSGDVVMLSNTQKPDLNGDWVWWEEMVNESGFLVGDYRVEYSLNDELVSTAEFTIYPFEFPAPEFVSIETGEDVAESANGLGYDLINPGDTFKAGISTIHAVVTTNYVTTDTTMNTIWYMQNDSGAYDQIFEYGGNPFEKSLTWQADVFLSAEGGYPVGNFRIEAYLNGELVDSIDFQVVP